MPTLRALFEMIAGVEDALDMAGAWKKEQTGLVLFFADGSELRFVPPGKGRSGIVDCSGAAWLATLARLVVDLHEVVKADFAIADLDQNAGDSYYVEGSLLAWFPSSPKTPSR